MTLYCCPIDGCDYSDESKGSVKGHITRYTKGDHEGENGETLADEIVAVDDSDESANGDDGDDAERQTAADLLEERESTEGIDTDGERRQSPNAYGDEGKNHQTASESTPNGDGDVGGESPDGVETDAERRSTANDDGEDMPSRDELQRQRDRASAKDDAVDDGDESANGDDDDDGSASIETDLGIPIPVSTTTVTVLVALLLLVMLLWAYSRTGSDGRSTATTTDTDSADSDGPSGLVNEVPEDIDV